MKIENLDETAADIDTNELTDDGQAYFIRLHDRTFMDSYFYAATILDKRSEKNKVFVAKNSGKI